MQGLLVGERHGVLLSQNRDSKQGSGGEEGFVEEHSDSYEWKLRVEGVDRGSLEVLGLFPAPYLYAFEGRRKEPIGQFVG
jgi:hypothetical protein